METVCNAIQDLVAYGCKTGLVDPLDSTCVTNTLLQILGLSDYTPTERACDRPLPGILADLLTFAGERGLIDAASVVERDLFDTRLMGALTPMPSTVITKFRALASESPEAATDYFYRLSRNCNYIRTDRVAKDLKWTVESEYGEIDITVNLSKPEKDPKAIAAAKLLPAQGYPKCALCHENEGYAGTLGAAARQNLRTIPITMDGKPWYLQYSPYVYYNEHCIAFSGEHVPMKVDRSTFVKLLDFTEQFPHYFLGSNADLPIVGGSILSHDHMQGGHYSFAMERATIEKHITFGGFSDISAGILHWPMSVIRLSGKKKSRLVDLADRILNAWRGYTDESVFVFANTNGEPHNTITPIARMRDGAFELDLVLRNNITTEEHPLGVFHPHAELHNIKKENIGLIEVMGLAVLPARLRNEISQMTAAILAGEELATIPDVAKHAAWFDAFRHDYTFTPENTEQILRTEIGRTFVRVLTDAGVFKRDTAGKEAFLRFCAFV